MESMAGNPAPLDGVLYLSTMVILALPTTADKDHSGQASSSHGSSVGENGARPQEHHDAFVGDFTTVAGGPLGFRPQVCAGQR
jgi:hypothetical protein